MVNSETYKIDLLPSMSSVQEGIEMCSPVIMSGNSSESDRAFGHVSSSLQVEVRKETGHLRKGYEEE